MAKETVLYVEDEESDVLFMRRAFAKAGDGLALQSVGNGLEAINYLSGIGRYADREQHPMPAAVLLDLNLPLISGFDVLAWLRQKSDCRTLPVVVFSSSTREEDKRKARELGANEYVEKPNSALLFVPVVEGLKRNWLKPSDS